MQNCARRGVLLGLIVASLFVGARAEEKKKLMPGKKELIVVRRGDSEFIFGGRTKIESYLEKNTIMLNSNIPDELQYIKHTSDLNFDYSFGEQKYGYEAVEAFATLSYKGAWGKALPYADRDAGPIAPTNVMIDNASLPGHSHTSGKLLVWFKEAWLQMYFNPIFNLKTKCLHSLKLGWFPFELDSGRGIAFGGFYGMNKELLGLYSYTEDKSAPGILLSGNIIKDRLLYDIYYGVFENRSKSWSDEWNMGKRHVIGREINPWIGEAKNDEVIAGRLKWKPFVSDKAGILDLEPYIFYNAASDQKIEIRPDAKTNWGSYGLNIEYSKGAFECGGDMAFNYGYERAFGIDRNQATIENNEGYIVERYNKILYVDSDKKVLVNTDTKKAAAVPYQKNVNDNNTSIIPGFASYKNASDRFRPTYKTTLHGWMTVVDGAYTFKEHDLKIALSYAYASGDKAPHAGDNKDAHYHGFVGLHEGYVGKRVPSFIVLDRRNLKRPTSLVNNDEEVGVDTTFTDMQIVGLGTTWSPKLGGKAFRFNPNILMFWKAFESKKWIIDPTITADNAYGKVSENENASSFMGTEINVISSLELLTDLKLYMNFGVFVPGKYFSDVKGMPVDKDLYAQVIKDQGTNVMVGDAAHYRIWNDTAYDLNIGFDYRF